MLVHNLGRRGSDRFPRQGELFESVTEPCGNVAGSAPTSSALSSRHFGEGQVFAEHGENDRHGIDTHDMLDAAQGSCRSARSFDGADGASVGISGSVDTLAPAPAASTLDTFERQLGFPAD